MESVREGEIGPFHRRASLPDPVDHFETFQGILTRAHGFAILLDRGEPIADHDAVRGIVPGEVIDGLVVGIPRLRPTYPLRGTIGRGGIVVDELRKGGGLTGKQAHFAACADEFDAPGAVEEMEPAV